MTTSVDVIGWKTTPSTKDIMTLFHLFHIDAIPPIPHLHPESGPYIYIYIYIYISPTFRVEMWNGWNRMYGLNQNCHVEWVEQDIVCKQSLAKGVGLLTPCMPAI